MRHLPLERNVTMLITRYEAQELVRFYQQLQVTGRTDVKIRLMTQSLKARAQKLLQFYRSICYAQPNKIYRDPKCLQSNPVESLMHGSVCFNWDPLPSRIWFVFNPAAFICRCYLTAYKGFKDGHGDSPSTGLLALTAALQLCDQASATFHVYSWTS